MSIRHASEANLIALTMLAIVAGAACGTGAGRNSISSPTPVAAVQPVASPSSPPAPSHVFVVVMENRSYEQALAGGYTAQLAAK